MTEKMEITSGAAAIKPDEPVRSDILADYHYFVPHIPELLGADAMFAARIVLRWPLVSSLKKVKADLGGSVNPAMPLIIREKVCYGAVRLICAQPPCLEECILMAKKWLLKNHLTGIERQSLLAVMGVVEWGEAYAVTIATIADMGKIEQKEEREWTYLGI